MQRNPHLAILSGFAAVILLGMLVLMTPWATTDGMGLSPVDALFTATSGTCVTGLSLIDVGTRLTTLGQGVLLLLIQVGGLGLMTVSTFFGLLLGINSRLSGRLALKEALNQVEDINTDHLIRRIVLFTLGVEAAGALSLFFFLPAPQGVSRVFSALFHSISAFCNAGFTLYRDSLSAFAMDPGVNVTIILLIVTGGIGFWVIRDVMRHLRSRRGSGPVPPLSLQSRVVLPVSGGLILAGALLFFLVEKGATPLTALFASVTTRTAGFNTVDTGALATPTILWMMVWMFIGASPGSTGGGTKTTTFAAMFAVLRSVLTGREQIELGRTTLPEAVVRRSMAIFFLALGWVAVASFLMAWVGVTGGAAPLEVLFETVSAFGTVGLSMGATAHLTAAGKVILVLTMFAGRIGPLTLILSLARRSEPPRISYPEQSMAIG